MYTRLHLSRGTVWVLTQKGTGSVAFVMVPKILDGRDKFESELNEAVAWRTLNKANLGVLGDGEFTRLTANVHDLYVRGFILFQLRGATWWQGSMLAPP